MGPKTKWTCDQDVLLLGQVSANLPFKAKHGLVMEKWHILAVTLDSLDGFTRSAFDGKKAQHRFNFLLEKHQDADKQSARASGVSEAYNEKRELLDSLASLVNDHKQKEQVKSEEANKMKDDDAAAGLMARTAAMESLGKRASDKTDRGTSDKWNKADSLIAFMASENSNEKTAKARELELRQLELEEQRLERDEARSERNEDRKERLQLAALEK